MKAAPKTAEERRDSDAQRQRNRRARERDERKHTAASARASDQARASAAAEPEPEFVIHETVVVTPPSVDVGPELAAELGAEAATATPGPGDSSKPSTTSTDEPITDEERTQSAQIFASGLVKFFLFGVNRFIERNHDRLTAEEMTWFSARNIEFAGGVIHDSATRVAKKSDRLAMVLRKGDEAVLVVAVGLSAYGAFGRPLKPLPAGASTEASSSSTAGDK